MPQVSQAKAADDVTGAASTARGTLTLRSMLHVAYHKEVPLTVLFEI